MENRYFDKNINYSVIEITQAVMAVSDHYQDFNSARSMVSQKIRLLGIRSVNGQKRNRYFTGMDAQKVFDAIVTQTKQVSLFVPKIPVAEKQEVTRKNKRMLTFDTIGGIVRIRPDDISMISLPPWYYFFTFRGWGAVVRTRNGKTLHIKEEPNEAYQMIKEAMEGAGNDSY